MKIPEGIKIYGNQDFRDKNCPKESNEQITFINRIRTLYPDTYGKIITHISNEGLLINGQFSGVNKSKALGKKKGASDIVLPGSPTLLIEMKRRDKTLSVISPEQIEYLLAAKECGAFCCIALGCDAATEAFNDWLKINMK